MAEGKKKRGPSRPKWQVAAESVLKMSTEELKMFRDAVNKGDPNRITLLAGGTVQLSLDGPQHTGGAKG